MPNMQNFMVNQMVLRLFQINRQTFAPNIAPEQQAVYLKQLQQKQLQLQLQYAQQKQQEYQNQNAPMYVYNPTQQAEQQQKNENHLINMANMMRLAMQGRTLAELMNEYQEHKHKAKGKEHRMEGSNDDGTLDDEMLADLDGDGNVSAFERERFENFLVTKVEETQPAYAKEYRDAEETGDLMNGATAGAEKFVEQVASQLNNDAVSPDAAPVEAASEPVAKKPSSPFSNPFSTKPTPPTSVG